jgi:hypothetical protein
MMFLNLECPAILQPYVNPFPVYPQRVDKILIVSCVLYAAAHVNRKPLFTGLSSPAAGGKTAKQKAFIPIWTCD